MATSAAFFYSAINQPSKNILVRYSKSSFQVMALPAHPLFPSFCRREDFADFNYTLRAVLLEHGIDDFVFQPLAFTKVCETADRKASLRSATLPRDPTEDNEQQRAIRNPIADSAVPTVDQLETKKKLATRIIISRLSAKVSPCDPLSPKRCILMLRAG